MLDRYRHRAGIPIGQVIGIRNLSPVRVSLVQAAMSNPRMWLSSCSKQTGALASFRAPMSAFER